MKTAVEWFFKYLFEKHGEFTIEQIKTENPKLWEVYQQAKEMEKQQHQKTWLDSTAQFDNSAEMTYRKEFEQYYNETFKTK
jgi:hypothetical protein